MCLDPGNGRCVPDDGGKLGNQKPEKQWNRTWSDGKSSSTGKGKTSSGTIQAVGKAPDGQPLVDGIRVPKYKELSEFTSGDPNTDTYAYRFQKWVFNSCNSGPDGKSWVAFCKHADKAGLLAQGDDPFGIKVNIRCITGHGDCTEAVITDLLTVATWGLGKAATSARFLAMAEKVAPESVAALRSIGLICSFRADTKVLLKNGKTKPISKIKPGEQVEAANPQNGRHQGAREVAARLVHKDSDLVDLKVRGVAGKFKTLHTTAGHPFWDETAGAWVPAASLTPGHKLITAENRRVSVVETTVRNGTADMYNLTVQQLHTYYVLAGRTPVLVHNSMATCSDAAFQTVLHNEQEIIDGKTSHIIPGMDSRTPGGADALADYVDHVTSVPGTPLLNGGGEA
ncbi:polymorphic toxin-type HINT domain-containing protein [Streptomyces sp. NPDC057694]|uniref:polymorphic toxin-type HINT domain-containing protein n=1 Tax=Streptomyces sp. NPDC057694 TaxID=3346216 RepID=UPI0036D14D14